MKILTINGKSAEVKLLSDSGSRLSPDHVLDRLHFGVEDFQKFREVDDELGICCNSLEPARIDVNGQKFDGVVTRYTIQATPAGEIEVVVEIDAV